jgi:adenylyltransferase/sulfurtransferase
MLMDDDQLLRYSRHILLPQIDIVGQERLLSSSALIIGLGGLGSPAAMYLAAAGIGSLVLNDFDRVDFNKNQPPTHQGTRKKYPFRQELPEPPESGSQCQLC